MNSATPGTPADELYQVSSDYLWTRKAYESLQEGDALHGEVIARSGVMASRVWGQCPRCEHFFDDRQTLTALTNLVGVRLAGPSRPGSAPEIRFAQVDVSCNCADRHPGAPEGTSGCGTSFRVELLVGEPPASTQP